MPVLRAVVAQVAREGARVDALECRRSRGCADTRRGSRARATIDGQTEASLTMKPFTHGRRDSTSSSFSP